MLNLGLYKLLDIHGAPHGEMMACTCNLVRSVHMQPQTGSLTYRIGRDLMVGTEKKNVLLSS